MQNLLGVILLFSIADDTDYSESEGLSSAQINKRLDSLHLRSPTSVTSETEEESRDGKNWIKHSYFLKLLLNLSRASNSSDRNYDCPQTKSA